MSSDLTWLLVRNNNSRIVKRGNAGVQPFSFESGNLLNIHSSRNSGYANRKTVDIREGKAPGSVAITRRVAKASPHALAKAQSTNTLKARSGNRRVAGKVSKQVAGYRPDLLKPALARANRVNTAVNKKAPTAAPAKKTLRGKKAQAAKAKASEMDVDVE